MTATKVAKPTTQAPTLVSAEVAISMRKITLAPAGLVAGWLLLSASSELAQRRSSPVSDTTLLKPAPLPDCIVAAYRASAVERSLVRLAL